MTLILDNARTKLSASSLTWNQKFNFDDSDLGRSLSSLVPNLTLAFLWPYAGVPHIKQSSLSIEAIRPFRGEFGDRFLNGRVKESVDPDDAVRE